MPHHFQIADMPYLYFINKHEKAKPCSKLAHFIAIVITAWDTFCTIANAYSVTECFWMQPQSTVADI